MRQLSSNIKYLLTQEEIATFYLVKLVTKSGELLYTTAPYDMQFNGQTYSADSGLLIVEAPRLSTQVDREAYKITFVDPTFSKRELFEDGLTGASVTVMVGLYNGADITVGGAAPGQPLLDPADVIVAYGGVADTQGYATSPEDGTVMAVIECSSPMASLGRINSFYTSKNSMMQVNINDTSFDQASVNSSKTTYLWGKA